MVRGQFRAYGGLAVYWKLWDFVVIQHAIHGQFGEHDDLLDRQDRAALWQVDVGGDVAGHQAGLGQGFAGMDQQAFAVLMGGDLEQGAGFVEAQGQGVGFEVMVEGAVGGVVEFAATLRAYPADFRGTTDAMFRKTPRNSRRL